MSVGELFFMARPGREVQSAVTEMLAASGLDARLGRAMFPSGNWHQSLSDLHPGDPERLARLLRAGARVRSAAFTLVLDRICSRGDRGRPIHWSLRGGEAKPAGLEALTGSLRAGIEAERIGPQGGHTAHVTLSYKAPAGLAGTVRIVPIAWTIDAFELVECRDRPYRYETVERWPLLPATDPEPGQPGLFAA